MSQFRLLRPIAVPRFAGAVGASGGLTISGGGGGGPGGTHWPGTVRTSASNSLADVQTTVDASSDGDVIVIPNGAVVWAGGISTTKQVLIRAATINPTVGGRSDQSLVITNNSSVPLFQMTTGNSYHCGIAGIRFNEGTGTANHVRFIGSGTKPPIFFDWCMEAKDRFGTSQDVCCLAALSLGHLSFAWRMQGVGASGPSAASACLVIGSPRAWASASTMGSLDTDGNVNSYFEDGTGFNTGTFPDLDVDGRGVLRYSLLDGVFGTSHGPSSVTGGRHIELYNCTQQCTTQARNHTGRYYWLRAGTGAFHHNLVKNASFPGEYGNIAELIMGEVDEDYGGAGGTGYPALRAGDTFSIQPGWGHNGSAGVIDPIYMYDHDAASDSASVYQSGVNGNWPTVVQANREYFPADGGSNPGAKPGYTPYTYPHPLQAGCPTT